MFPLSAFRRLFLAMTMASGCAAAWGATSTWVGNTSTGNWDASANWSGSVEPATTATAIFTTNGSSAPKIDVASGIGELEFTGTFNQTFTGTSTLTLTSATGISNIGANTITFDNPFAVSNASQTWNTTSTGGLTLASTSTVALGGDTLTLKANTGTTISMGGIISGTSASKLIVTNTTTGIVNLSAANTYSGATSVTAGVLQLGNINAIQDSSSAVMSGTGELQFSLTGSNTYAGPGLTISGTGVSSGGAINNVASGTNTFNGAITLGAASTIQDNGSLTLGGNISTTASNFALTINGSGTPKLNGVVSGGGALTYSGNGTLTLNNANTYTGATSVGASGTLALTNNGAVQDSSGVTVVSGGTLEFNKTGTNTFTGPTATINGTGGGDGAIVNVASGTNTYTGNVTLGAASTIEDNGSLTLSGNISTGTNFALTVTGNGTPTFGGVVSGGGKLIYSGGGTLTLDNANTYTGATSVTTGILSLTNNGAIQDSSGTTISSGAELQFGSTGTNAYTGNTITISGTGGGNGAINNVASGINSYAGNVTLGAASTIQDNGALTLGGNLSLSTFALTVNGNGTPQVNGVVSGSGSLTYSGNGTLTLNNANTYTGATTVSSGTLALTNNAAIQDSTALTVNGTGTLEFNKTGTNTFTGPAMTIGGTGGGDGAINNVASGTNTYSGNITLGAASTIQDNGTLTLGGTISTTASNYALTVNGNGAPTLNGIVSGGGSLTYSGNGTLTLNNANTYTGATSVTSGTLALTNNAAIQDSTALTVNGTGTLEFNKTGTNTFTGPAATISGTGGGDGAINNVASGTNTYSGNITLGAASTIQDNGTLTLGGTISTTASNFALTINGTGAPKLNGIVSGGGALIYSGSGTLTLNNANTYTGATSVASGNLALTNNAAIQDSTALTVLSGGTIQFDKTGTNTFTGPAMTISGNGGSDGAINNIASGTNTYNGAITLGAASTIQDNGALTLGGNISTTASNYALTVNGTGAPILSGIISGGGALIYSGSDTLVLTGTNNYTGGTTISSGTLQFGNNTSTGTIASASAILDNGTLAFDLTGATTVGSAISGSGGVSQNDSGAITLSGNNSYSGATVVSSGDTLKAGSSTAFGNGSAVTVNGTGTLSLNGNNVSVGSIAGASGSTLALGTNTLTTGSASGSTTFAGTITSTSSAGGLTENGASNTLVLTGNNTFTGATSVAAGILALGSTAAIQDSTALTVSSGGELQFDKTGTNTFTAPAATISGTGVGGVGAINNVASGTNTYNGAITLGAASTIQDNGALTLGGNISTTASNYALTVNGTGTPTFSGTISGGGELIYSGSGTLTLGGANTYTGGTTVASGTLDVTNNTALGVGATSTTVDGGARLNLGTGVHITPSSPSGTPPSLTLNNNATLGSTDNTGAVSSFEGNITLTGNATITVGSTLLYLNNGPTGVYNNTTIDLGTNPLNTLTFAPTSATGYTSTYENSGTGSFSLDPTNILVFANLTGSGGILVNGAGTVTLRPSQTNVSAYTGTTSVQSGTLIVQGFDQHGNPSIDATIGSSNIYIGTSTSTGGGVTAILEGPSSTANAVSYDIGTLNQTYYTSNANVTVYANGEFNLNGSSQGINLLTLQGGLVQEGAGSQLPGLTVTGVTTVASPNLSQITFTGYNSALPNDVGYLYLSGMTPTFNIVTGSTLQVDSVVNNGLGFTSVSGIYVDKTGTGTLIFTGANRYSGITDIQGGILNIQNNLALGGAGGSLGDTTNGTVVGQGAQLQLQQNGTTGALTIGYEETLTLDGNGSSTAGLLNLSGNNTYNGFIDVKSASEIDANTGTLLTIANTSGVNAGIINGLSANQSLTFGGNGNITVNGGIGSDANDSNHYIGNLAYTGNGTLTLAGSDSYTGTTSITGNGTVQLTNNNSLSGTGTTVNSGATLQFAGTINEVAAGGITINGTGTSSNGAIENLNGVNTYAGTVTLGSDSRINADSGTTFTINSTGGITGTHNLTIGGGGNVTINGAVTIGSGTLTLDGAGTVTLASAPSGTSPTNTFTGLTTVTAGTLAFAANYQLGTGNVVQVGANGTLSVGNYTQSLGSITGNGNLVFGGSNSFVTINANDTFSGTVTGAGTLIIGPGVTFTIGANFNDPNLNIILAGGSTLNLGGYNSTFGNLTFENTTTNAAYDTNTLSFTGNSVVDFTGTVIAQTTPQQSSSVLTLSVTNWTNGKDYFYSTTIPDAGGQGSPPLDQIVFQGGPPWTGANTTWLTYTDGPDNDHQITPVPEPSFYGAMIAGFATLVAAFTVVRRRSEKSNKA